MKMNARSFVRYSAVVILTLVLIMVYSPDYSFAAVKPTKIVVSPASVTLTVGQKKTVKVKKVIPTKAVKTVTYKSSNSAIAAVNVKGVITAKKAGSTQITVTSKANRKVKARVKCTVKAKQQKLRKKALVVYFSQAGSIKDPEKLYEQKKDDFDAVSGASILKDDSGKIVGDVGLMAEWIADYLHTDSYGIKVTNVVNVNDPTLGYQDTVDPGNLYPFSQRDTQKYFRKYEQPQGINPPIAQMTSSDPDLSKYDVIYLGFPNWDGEPPHAVYTFINEHKDELNGKTIAIFASGHYRRNGFSEAQMIIGAKLPDSTIIKEDIFRAHADYEAKNRAKTKADLISWVNSTIPEVNAAKEKTSDNSSQNSKVNEQKKIAETLVGQKLTAKEIEQKVGPWTMKHADTNGCDHNVSSMRFYYDGFIIYTRPVGISGSNVKLIRDSINDDTLFEVMQIA